MKVRSLVFMFILFTFSFSTFGQTVKEKKEAQEPEKQEKVSEKKKETRPNPKKDIAKLTVEKAKTPKEESIVEYLNSKPKSSVEKKKGIESQTGVVEKPEPKKKELGDKYEVQMNITIDSLSNNFGTWKQASLFAKRKFNDGKIVWGEYRVSERRNLRDKEVFGGLYHPFKNRFGYTIEASYSNTNQFVGKYTLRGEVEKVFKKGWVGHIGAKHKNFGSAKVSTLYGQVEKYWGNNRVAYTLYATHVTNAGTSPSNTISYHRYYGERINSYGVTFGFGNEEEFVDPAFGILKTKTVSLSGSFKRWINNDIGIQINGTIHRQGDFYYRRGLNVGVLYRF